MKPAPTTLADNIIHRRIVVDNCAGNFDTQQDVWIRCKRDLIFYINTFCWTYSPKDYPDYPTRPFILYPYQEEAVLKLNAAFGKNDLLVEKSRDMGATWMCLAVIMWRWHFYPRQSFLLGSRKEELVDKVGDPKSLFWKLLYLLENFPGWFQPNLVRNKLHLHNEDSGSTIDGESTNDDFARGDRRTAILLDEFPAVENGYSILNATRDATKCRILNGTPQGAKGAYYDTRVKLNDATPERIIRCHWSLHPEKSVGLYTSVKADEHDAPYELRILDAEYKFPEDYPFILDGKQRSPWYDEECRRAANQQEIAQELDIDYAASGWQYFDPKKLAEIQKKWVMRPLHVGEVSYEADGKHPQWAEHAGGRLQLWIHPDENAQIIDGNYIIGCDIATGKGGEMSSNSVASIANRDTGEKVAQLTTNEMNPWQFATYVVALCRWFHNAFLIWEDNGPGGEFSKQIRELKYSHIFYREDEKAFVRKKTRKAGWYSTKDTKKLLLAEYSKALIEGRFINRCQEALAECAEYIHEPSGSITHARSSSTIDPTAAGENHGDMVIADALANRGMSDIHKVEPTTESTAPPGSFLARRLEANKRAKAQTWY